MPLVGTKRVPAQKVKEVFPGVFDGAVKDTLARGLALGGVVGGEEAVHVLGSGVELAVDVGTDGRGSTDRDDGADGSADC